MKNKILLFVLLLFSTKALTQSRVIPLFTHNKSSYGFPPTNISPPIISGTPGQGITLNSTNGTWTGNGISYNYQWQRNGVDISGAINNVYTQVSADNSTSITLVVTANNPFGFNHVSSNAIQIVNIPISISGRTVLQAFGDSYTIGSNASPSDSAYINKFKSTETGITTLVNNAVSGTGAWKTAAVAQGVSFTPSQTIISVMIGLNDIRRNGSAAKTLKKIEAGYRTVFLKAVANVITAAGSGSVTKTGTWIGYGANTVGGKFATGTPPGNFAINNTVSGSTLSWTFTGTAFGIQFSGSDGVISTYGGGTVAIDGVTVATVNLNNWYDGITDGTYDNKRGPLAYTYHGFTNTSHTVVITKTDNSSFPVDFFATVNSPSNSAVLLFCEIPYLISAGYNTSPNLGSVGATDLANSIILSLVLEFIGYGYSICYVPVNTFYNLSIGVSGDNIHPNNTGHYELFSALEVWTF